MFDLILESVWIGSIFLVPSSYFHDGSINQ